MGCKTNAQKGWLLERASPRQVTPWGAICSACCCSQRWPAAPSQSCLICPSCGIMYSGGEARTCAWSGQTLTGGMLDGLGFARRQMLKVLPGSATPHRDAQFRHLAHLIQEFLVVGNPVLSIDTKKKKCLGTLYRDGKVFCQQALKAFDHNFPSLASDVIIPHGIYDLARHEGWMHVGFSRDTTAFACDSLRLFWHRNSRRLDPNASTILLLCDGGGSNSCHKHLCKEDLPAVVNHLAVPIRVAHYPAYCLKFNPIERRLFSHVTRVCHVAIFDSL